jgi:hypothetical protein
MKNPLLTLPLPVAGRLRHAPLPVCACTVYWAKRIGRFNRLQLGSSRPPLQTFSCGSGDVGRVWGRFYLAAQTPPHVRRARGTARSRTGREICGDWSSEERLYFSVSSVGPGSKNRDTGSLAGGHDKPGRGRVKLCDAQKALSKCFCGAVKVLLWRPRHGVPCKSLEAAVRVCLGRARGRFPSP